MTKERKLESRTQNVGEKETRRKLGDVIQDKAVCEAREPREN